jgi:hypothetical protein
MLPDTLDDASPWSATRIVAYWHFADKQTQPSNGRYWTNNGQGAAQSLNG